MIPTRNTATAWRVIEGEAVILSLDTKILRGLNAVGSRVWELIDGRRSVDEIVDVIAREFATERMRAGPDVDAFVQTLLDRSLVTVRP